MSDDILPTLPGGAAPRADLPGTSRRALLGMAMAGGAVAGNLVSAGGLVLPARAATPKRGGKLTVAGYASSTKDTLDPAHASNSTDYSRLFMFYNGLTVFDEHLNPLPDLAESVETTDATHWVVKLRKGIAFHDGSPLTAADVVFSLARHKDPATSSVVQPIATQMQEIKATGPLEVQITLVGPNSELPSLLAIYQMVIVKNGTQDFSKGIGTGPFMVKEFSPGVRSVAVRNPHYFHNGRPYLDEVTFFGITDDAARVNALLSGDIDIASGITPLATRQIKAAKGFAILNTAAGNYTDLIMHTDAPQIGNPDFIMAMKYLQDREKIRDSIFLGYATIGNDQPVAPSNPYFDAGLPQRQLDLDRAKFHLKKAGMLTSKVRLVSSVAATGSPDMAVILQDTARKIGFDIEIDRVPADGYWSNYWLKAPFAYGNVNPRPTANILLTLFFQSTAPWNESHWKNPGFDKLLVASRAETDAAKRKQMYAQMQKLISDEAGIGIPVFISDLDAYSTRVKGFHAIPTGDLMGFNFAQNVWVDG